MEQSPSSEKKVAAPFKNATPNMEPKGLHLCSQDHAIRPYPTSAESGPLSSNTT